MNNTTSTNFFHWFWNIYLEDGNERGGFLALVFVLTLVASMAMSFVFGDIIFLKIWIGTVALGLLVFLAVVATRSIRTVLRKYREWRAAQLERTMNILRS